MTDEELDAMISGLDTISCLRGMDAEIIQNARAAITTLHAQLAEAHKDGSQLAAWQCLFDDGKTGIVCDDWGNQYCAMQRRAERAEAALAAQIEVDAEIAEDLNDYIWDYSTGNRGRIGSDPAADAIRNQPHDRNALDRMLTEARDQTALGMVDVMATAAKEAREKALREAADVVDTYDRQDGGATKAILALIEAPK